MNHKFRPIALLFAVLTAFASLNADATAIEFQPVVVGGAPNATGRTPEQVGSGTEDAPIRNGQRRQ